MPDYAKTLEEELLLAGRMFTQEADVDSTSLDLLIRNPMDSGINVVTFNASVSHDDNITISVYDDVSGISGGTELDADNNFIGDERMEKSTVLLDPTFTGENEHSQISYPGSGTEDALSGTMLAISEGNDLLVSVQDDSGSAKVMSTLISWGEIKIGTYE